MGGWVDGWMMDVRWVGATRDSLLRPFFPIHPFTHSPIHIFGNLNFITTSPVSLSIEIL